MIYSVSLNIPGVPEFRKLHLLCTRTVADLDPALPTCSASGQSPLHILGQYGRENAATIFELFLECMPEYPLDKPDAEGNTGTSPAQVSRLTGPASRKDESPDTPAIRGGRAAWCRRRGSRGVCPRCRRGAPQRLVWDTRASEVSRQLPSHAPVHTPARLFSALLCPVRPARASEGGLCCSVCRRASETGPVTPTRGGRLVEALPAVLLWQPMVLAFIRGAVTTFPTGSCMSMLGECLQPPCQQCR